MTLYFFLIKLPFHSSIPTEGTIDSLFKLANNTHHSLSCPEGKSMLLTHIILLCSQQLSDNSPVIPHDTARQILGICLRRIYESSTSSVCLISSERLIDTCASLNSFSRHSAGVDSCFPV